MTPFTDGVFPFGRPNTVRPARFATSTRRAVVVGVYPSAWHISWRAPDCGRSPERTGAIAAMAVDVEPTVFWDGSTDDFVKRLADWSVAVGFKAGDNPGEHGHISPVSPSTNGSSGRKVVSRYLDPLGLAESSVTFTDIWPVFVVKHASGTGGRRREQGDAIRQEYDPIAQQLGLPNSTLPRRPPSTRLPQMAAARFGPRLVDDLIESSAEIVVTLGVEVWNALVLIPELSARPPAPNFEALYGPSYGRTGTLQIAGKAVTWLPLVHPGLLKGEPPTLDTALESQRRTTSGWNILHSKWAASQPTSREPRP